MAAGKLASAQGVSEDLADLPLSPPSCHSR